MSNVTPIHPSVQPTTTEQADTVTDTLNELETELLCARSVVDMLHDVWAQDSEGVIKESIASDSLPGVLYDVLQRLRRCEALSKRISETMPTG
ncbi:hypothetical protein [Povalibacter sp.]|uniref:hypothetical protein n=1 Tax=Povalibacter sp. TaxID=1962978 RepID=UPI002F415974